MEQEILLTRHDKAGFCWAEITLNRPDKGNALTLPMLECLADIADELRRERDTRAVVLRASGRFFCTGGDIEAWGGMTPHDMGRDWILKGIDAFERISNLPQPVIAAVNGFALGGGCELAMACDIRIASEKAKFGQPEVTLGIIPGFCGTQRLPRLVGKGVAKELTYTGDMIDAQEALRIGLVNKVTTPEELLPTAKAMAGRIMQRGQFAVQMAKVSINTGMNTDMETGSVLEASLFGVTCATEDKKEGMTAFVEKRKPVFPGK